MVAAELEFRWNEALGRVAALESRYAETMSALDEFTAGERERLLELGGDLRELWNHPQAPMALKKRLLRTLLEEIIIDIRDEDPPKVHLRYGIFIPNTWRRCGVATGSLACTVLVMNLVFGLCDETIPCRYLFSYSE